VKMSERLLAGLLVCLLATGCVTTTTTTGGVNPDADRGDAADLNYQLGARYYRNGNFDLARDRLQYSIELNPKYAVAHYTLALAYEALGNLRLATASYEQAIRLSPKDHKVQNAYAVFLCNQSNFDGASKHFALAANITENDNAEITLTNAGVCMMQKPDQVRAESFFREAIEYRSNHGEALIQLCLLKFAQADYLASRAFLQRYLGGNIPTAGVLYLGIQIEDKLGDERAKTEFLNRLLREFPISPEARRALEAG
jgi:type IV pilus assembly protein PilF